MRLRLIFALTILFSVGAFVSAGEKPRPIGRITATYGQAAISGADGQRGADLHAMLASGERIQTNGGGVSLLLASRVVIKIDGSTSVRVSENLGETSIRLEYGTIQVFCGKRPASMGAIAIHDDNGRVEASTSGVILVSHDPRDAKTYYACEESAVVLEPSGDDHRYALPASNQAIVVAGKIETIGEIDALTFTTRKKSFERLGQSAVRKGADTFRLRSRTADLNMAMSSLAAAGWIDPRNLPRAQRLEPAKPKTKQSAASGSDADRSNNDSARNETQTSAKSGSDATDDKTVAAPAPSDTSDAAVETVDAAEGNNSDATRIASPSSEVQVEVIDVESVAVDVPDDAGVNEATEAPMTPEVDVDISAIDVGDAAAPSAIVDVDSAPAEVVDQPMADIAPELDASAIDLSDAAAPPVDIGDTVVAPDSPAVDVALPDVEVPEVVASPEAPEIELPAEIEIEVPDVPEIEMPDIDTPVVESPPVDAPQDLAPPVDIGQPEVEPPVDVAPPVVDIEPPDQATSNLPEPVELGEIGAGDVAESPVVEAPPIEIPAQVVELPSPPESDVVVPDEATDVVKDIANENGEKSHKD